MTDNCDNVSVRVAVRVRPLVQSEIARGCKDILEVIPDHDQIIVQSIGKDTAFTYNYVLSSESEQDDLYNRCVQPLVGNLFKGYNVTIMAYGQTGSGKTHSMGTTYLGAGDMGVIPRVIHDIFDTVKDNFAIDFDINVSFMELYQEVLYDLLSGKPRDQCVVDLREDPTKGILIPGLSEVPVKSAEEVLSVLQKGSAGRATGSTAMNSQSSRSHAVFTINISMNNKENRKEQKTAKLHLVDLAGSERPKKTGAAGNTFKEGVLINKGLFVLGNVISCLGDEKAQNGFIPYRDSNLTRLLKDSLGGNSITLMIACVSPADYNLDETLSTLRYADRARKIRNKPIVNQDAKAAEINELKKTVQQLRLQILGQGGPMVCPAEIELLKKEILESKLKIRELTVQLSVVLHDNTGLHEKIAILQNANEQLSKKICKLKDQYDITFNNISIALDNNDTSGVKDNIAKLQLIQSQFLDIDKETKKTELEIKDHEEFFSKPLISAVSSNVGESSKEFQEKHETHTTRQMTLNQQLSEIQKQLVLKESLAKQLITNNQYMVDYQALSEHEAKIAKLEKEKEDLLRQLKSVGNSGKSSEQHRKRVQELETQLADLKKKVQEHSRLIKLKAGDEVRISKLNQEIVQMKQAKVKLVRTMRDESEKFRQWKMQKERECLRLKQQDRKKENEIVKMKVMHNKQQIVFKARVEQAEAVNKRLKNLLALRQQALDAKNTGKADKVEPWLKREYDLYMNLVEAEATLNVLLEDRATLRQQLDELRDAPGDADPEQCKAIEDDLELRSVQIQDLQQKLSDSDEEQRSKPFWGKLQTMGEAKFGLKFLCSKAAEAHREKVLMQNKLSEWEDSHNEAQEKNRQLEERMHGKEEQFAQLLVDLQKDYEEKIAILLRQIRGSSDSNDEESTYNIQQKKIEALEDQVKMLEDNNKELTEKIKYIEKISQEHRDKCLTPVTVKKEKILRDNSNTSTSPVPRIDVNDATFVKGEISDSSLLDIEDDVENDPDWRKTPLAKRLLEEKKKFAFVKSTLDFNEDEYDRPSKRSSEGGCSCKTNCTSARCGCKRLGGSCGPHCRCSEGLCANRDGISSADNSGDQFKLPSFDELPKKKSKKTRRLFSQDIPPAI